MFDFFRSKRKIWPSIDSFLADVLSVNLEGVQTHVERPDYMFSDFVTLIENDKDKDSSSWKMYERLFFPSCYSRNEKFVKFSYLDRSRSCLMEVYKNEENGKVAVDIVDLERAKKVFASIQQAAFETMTKKDKVEIQFPINEVNSTLLFLRQYGDLIKEEGVVIDLYVPHEDHHIQSMGYFLGIDGKAKSVVVNICRELNGKVVVVEQSVPEDSYYKAKNRFKEIQGHL